MHKFNIFSAMLWMALMTTSPLQAATTSTDGCSILGEGCGAAEPLQPQLIALSWGDVAKFLFGKKGSKGRRLPSDPPESDVCMMVPGIMEDLKQPLEGTSNTVMTRQPLFLWQGEATWIELYDANNPINKPIWTREIQPGEQHIFYDGDVPLVPNSLGYYWQLTLKYPPDSNPDETPRKAFMILDEETTAAIQRKFNKIEQQSISDTEKAFKRVEILSEEKYGPTNNEALGADILAEIYQLDERPSALASLNEFDFCAESEASVS
ncbi:hypothetical protein HRE53_30285 (plasmid) [Acaryochloris sp. 'Moss Beach']|uniref:hypothetical protein n=1 Tax=Acaryochloris sp. 'Moss Beach' TaxID=2740837 RepID=UPI001F414FD5|nr:hypothetical protein [Acaryochloris sp. 'Moss Beach']UJB73021.1 hypothetical protein HRE53_30285 [Acaryochloris sp. 'Moss Beach']